MIYRTNVYKTKKGMLVYNFSANAKTTDKK